MTPRRGESRPGVAVALVIAGLVVALGAAGALASGGGEAPSTRAAARGAAPGSGGAARAPRAGAARGAAPGSDRALLAQVDTIARRVERIRGLRFRRLPKVHLIDPAQARREALRDFDRSTTVRGRASTAELLELLGLLPPGSSMLRIQAAVFGEQVAGFYDPRSKRLVVVRGAGRGAAAEITLAHELTHALEDQHFGLGDDGGGGGDDAASAEQALDEGTATEVMERYARRHLSTGDLLALGSVPDDDSGIPPYIMSSLLMTYEAGQRFVAALRSAAGGGWGLVNLALRSRPPISTRQVLDPQAWLRVSRPVRVRVAPGRVLGHRWRRVRGGVVGEIDTAQILRRGPPQARGDRVARGWRGDRYELWRRGPLPAAGCAAPCRARDALVVATSWATSRAARAGAAALGSYVRRTQHGRAIGSRSAAEPLRWRLPAGAAAVVRRGRTTVLALAPSPALAARLASAGSVRGSAPAGAPAR